MDLSELRAQLRMHGRTQAALAERLHFPDASYVSKILSGKREIKARELEIISKYLRDTDPQGRAPDLGPAPDLPPPDPRMDYVEVEVLPTFAGMGGPGTGDDDRRVALLSRYLVRDELRADPHDLLIINVRGTSMEPLFRHGDQIVVDRRDTSPTQPGPFALLYPDGYVVKNVTWTEKRTKLRLSSENAEFPPEVWDPEEVQIIGRPVWFARRL